MPKGSILSPISLVCINKILCFVKNCDPYNFGDANTLSLHFLDFDKIIQVLKDDSKLLIGWAF